MQEYILKYIATIGLAGVISVLMFWKWIKSFLHSEIVKPYTEEINKRISVIENNQEDLEERFRANNNETNKRLDKIDDSIIGLTKTVSELVGQLKILIKEDK